MSKSADLAFRKCAPTMLEKLRTHYVFTICFLFEAITICINKKFSFYTVSHCDVKQPHSRDSNNFDLFHTNKKTQHNTKGELIERLVDRRHTTDRQIARQSQMDRNSFIKMNS